VREQELAMVGEMPTERSAQLILLLLTWTGGVGLCYGSTADQGRIGREGFLLSAVAPSTSTRHPREARPINWAQRGGLASGGGNFS
jgi:hypothetical protein